MTELDETDRWVARLNKMAREMDEAATSIHPSAWPEVLGLQMEAYRRLAKSLSEAPPQ